MFPIEFYFEISHRSSTFDPYLYSVEKSMKKYIVAEIEIQIFLNY